MTDSQHDSLPSWWFEVDETDDIDTNTSLLQELEIDLPQIYRSTVWMLLGPCGCLCRRHAGKHPLISMLPTINAKSQIVASSASVSPLTPIGPIGVGLSQVAQIDFWGPCSIVRSNYCTWRFICIAFIIAYRAELIQCELWNFCTVKTLLQP